MIGHGYKLLKKTYSIKRQNAFTKDEKFIGLEEYFNFLNVDNYAKDFGCMISQKPLAVFTPPNVESLQQFLKLANDYLIKFTCRGKGNSAYGQSQLKDGVIIDLKNMDVQMEFTEDDCSSVTVPAHKTWCDVTEFTLAQNKTVPVTVDNLDLTVAGTLSYGALGGTSYRLGCGADNINSLGVVTADGEYHTCSKSINSELYNAVLCGMGQFGIIVDVTIPLLEAKSQVNMYFFAYDNPENFLEAQKMLYDSKVFDHLKGFARINEKTGNWEYVVEAATYYDEQEDPVVTAEYATLSPDRTEVKTMTYREFINDVTAFVNVLREQGKLDAPHPWYNLLIPEHEIGNHLVNVPKTPLLTGVEPIIIYPMKSSHFQQPLFMKPDCQTFYLVGALFNTSFSASKDFPYEDVLAKNKEIYLSAHERGACRYPVDAIPFTPDDWKNHFGDKWDEICELKKQCDPNNLLSNSLNIFESYKSGVVQDNSPRL